MMRKHLFLVLIAVAVMLLSSCAAKTGSASAGQQSPAAQTQPASSAAVSPATDIIQPSEAESTGSAADGELPGRYLLTAIDGEAIEDHVDSRHSVADVQQILILHPDGKAEFGFEPNLHNGTWELENNQLTARFGSTVQVYTIDDGRLISYSSGQEFVFSKP